MLILNREPPAYRGVYGEPRVFKLVEIIYYIDDYGQRWAIPSFFLHDKRSTPRPFWSIAPPSIGWQDVAWTVHDFEYRCYELLGLSLKDVDGARFVSVMLAVNKSRFRAGWHSAFVRIKSAVRPSEGNGLHRKSKYNGLVLDSESGELVTLKEWVTTYYSSDGSGLNDKLTFPVEVL